jgi:hypothetical protein
MRPSGRYDSAALCVNRASRGREQAGAYRPRRILSVMAKRDDDPRGGDVMRKLEDELRPLLIQWDPIGLAEDLPADEYDCLIAPVLTELRGHPTEPQLTMWLGHYAERHFGLTAPPEENRAAARALLGWWQVAESELPRGTPPTGTDS